MRIKFDENIVVCNDCGGVFHREKVRYTESKMYSCRVPQCPICKEPYEGDNT